MNQGLVKLDPRLFKHLEQFVVTDRGCQAGETLPSTATNSDQQIVAAGHLDHSDDASYVLNGELEQHLRKVEDRIECKGE